MHIFLTILSIIGYVLLGILGLIFFILLLILLCPFNYRLKAKGKGKEWNVKATVTWLFGALRASFVYPDPGEPIVKVLWFQIYQEKKSDTDAANIENSDKVIENDSDNVIENDFDKNAAEIINDSVTEEHDPSPTKKTQKHNRRNKRRKHKNISYTFHELYGKIKLFWKDISYYWELLTDNQTSDFIDFCVKRFGKMLRVMAPQKAKGYVDYGTGSPDTTAYIFGIWSIIRTKCGQKLCVTPDFEEGRIEADVTIRGCFCLLPLGIQALMIVANKNFRLLIKRLKRHKKNMEKAKRKTAEELKEYE